MSLPRALPLLFALACAAPAAARTWTDPGMERAVQAADLIVRVEAPAAGSRTAPRVRFRVLDTLEGRAPAAVTVGNLHDPARCPAPVFRPREQLYLLLIRDRWGRYTVPTPTFGRFPIRDGRVRYAALRGTHLRVDLPQADFEAYIRLLAGRPDPAWLTGLRGHLQETGLGAQGAPLTRLYLALEALAIAGTRDDADLVRRFAELPAPYQLRISALRALTRCARREAAETLFAAAAEDPEAAVRTAAARCLGRVARPDDLKRILRLAATASQKTVHFTGPTDPRTNAWPAPRVALLGVVDALARRDRSAAKRAVPALLRLVDDAKTSLEALGAALRALTRAGEDAVAHLLVARLGKHSDLRGRLTDAALCATLQELTRRPLGIDPPAWRLWLKTRR